MIFNNPDWLKKYLEIKNNIDSKKLIEEINLKYCEKTNKKDPVISIVIPAFNEESAILSCILSLINQETQLDYEIIVVNNNSTDKTADLLKRLDISSFNQNLPGPGPSRQLGQEKSRGKIIFTADADCLYSPKWVEVMHKYFKDNSVNLIYGKHYFIGTKKVPRWQLAFYEIFRDIVTEARNLKRPFLNAHTLNMAYRKELGLKIGFDMRNIRGSDGRFAFDFMKFGKIKYIRNSSVGTWTLPRTLYRNRNSLVGAFFYRILNEIKMLPNIFLNLKITIPKPHQINKLTIFSLY